MSLRPESNAASQGLPLPAKGSSTSSPGSEKLRIRGANAVTGFGVGVASREAELNVGQY